MKKKLLIWNVIFYAVLYSISLLYVGYEYGELSYIPYNGPEYFILPAVYLVLLVIGIFLVREWEYLKSKSYYTMGAITLAYSCLLWGSRLFFFFQGRLDADHWDVYVYPAAVFCFSVIISVIYIIVAIKTQKENRKQIVN